MTKVDLYLPIEHTSLDQCFCALSIPRADIERLTHRPLKWLRLIAFTVCGAKGHLSTTCGGDIADYENVSLDDLDSVYYTPEGRYHWVDAEAWNARDKGVVPPVGSREDFRQVVLQCDRICVFTTDEVAQAAHILPRSKSDVYITFVINDRFELYEDLPFARGGNVDIDCVQNGIMLRDDMHRRFDQQLIAFLKTPNFAMVPADVKSPQGSASASKTTLQWMVQPTTHEAVSLDAPPGWGDHENSPPSILLDYLYGAVVVKHWGMKDLSAILGNRYRDDYSGALARKLERTPESDDPKSESSEPSDSSADDPTWEPPGGQWKGRTKTLCGASGELPEPMDPDLITSMTLQDSTPQPIAAQWKKWRKETEQPLGERSIGLGITGQWLGDVDPCGLGIVHG